jgi:predicted RNase H-like nuclease (RuvC/YqgF family)
MKRNLLKLIVGSFAVLMVLAMAETGSAQPRKARGKVYTKAEVEAVIRRVETRTDNFVGNFDESLDDSGLDGSEREDNLMEKVRRLENETDELRNQFDRSDSWIENKSQVRTVLNLATDIDKVVKRRKLGKETETNWTRLKYELNTLAKIYNLPKVGSNQYN